MTMRPRWSRRCTRPGMRAEADLRNEKINYKVREHSLAKVPILLVVGKREAEERTVSVRRLGSRGAAGDETRRGGQAARGRGDPARSARDPLRLPLRDDRSICCIPPFDGEGGSPRCGEPGGVNLSWPARSPGTPMRRGVATSGVPPSPRWGRDGEPAAVMNRSPTILTIGHSRHPLARFIGLLEGAGATAVADVRSAPVSRFSPHFNKAALAAALAARRIDYIFLGNKLGGRPGQPAMYTKGVADYGKMAASNEFRAGIALLTEAAGRHRVAAMCSEADPLDCHRCLLVARALARDGGGGCSHSFLGGGHAAPRGRGSAARSRRSRRAGFAASVTRRAAGRRLSCPRPQARLCRSARGLGASPAMPGASQYPEWLA